MISPQLDEAPEGFVIIEQSFSVRDAQIYERELSALPFDAVRMRGRMLRRRVSAFGIGFGTNFQTFRSAPELPPVLLDIRNMAASKVSVDAPDFNQALVQLYPGGASIGWHRDAALFGSVIIGVSFGSVATMRFRHEHREQAWSVAVPPRSVYIISGSSRREWEHSIAPLKDTRISVTYRSFAPTSQSAASFPRRSPCPDAPASLSSLSPR